jgi:fatty-acyl-CoA synthase
VATTHQHSLPEPAISGRNSAQLTDRLKDVIKSGGEWISSVDLENGLVAHPAVADAAVIAIADPRWQERPLACVVMRDGTNTSVAELRAFLAPQFLSWWLPENWTFMTEIPKTSVGKKDKKQLRALYSEGELQIMRLPAPSTAA